MHKYTKKIRSQLVIDNTAPAVDPDPIAADEWDVLAAVRDAALEDIPRDRRPRAMEREEKRRGKWDLSAQNRSAKSRALLRHVLNMAGGMTEQESLTAVGLRWRDVNWARTADPVFSGMVRLAKESQWGQIEELARQRVADNLKTGEDGGTRAAMFVLDRARLRDKPAEDGMKATGGGVTFNINVAQPSLPAPIDVPSSVAIPLRITHVDRQSANLPGNQPNLPS